MKIDVTDEQAFIPSMPGRKQLILCNEGPESVRYGWESATTSDDSETDGVLLTAGQTLALGGRELDLAAQLYLICASGETATVSYTERG